MEGLEMTGPPAKRPRKKYVGQASPNAGGKVSISSFHPEDEQIQSVRI